MNAIKQPAMHDLEELFRNQVKNLYAAERRGEKTLEQFALAAKSPTLRAALHQHAKQTADHAGRLENVFASIGLRPSLGDPRAYIATADACAAAMADESDPNVHDAAIIAAVQTLEHLEIAGYGCARAWARQLGHDRAADLLAQTLDEEKDTDHRLTKIAETINLKAAHRKAYAADLL